MPGNPSPSGGYCQEKHIEDKAPSEGDTTQNSRVPDISSPLTITFSSPNSTRINVAKSQKVIPGESEHPSRLLPKRGGS